MTTPDLVPQLRAHRRLFLGTLAVITAGLGVAYSDIVLIVVGGFALWVANDLK